MSASGQKRTNHHGLKFTVVRFGPKADKRGRSWNVRYVPTADSCPQQERSLFDYLVSAAEQRQRNVDTERLGGFEVDDQLDFCDLHNWQIGRLLAL
jgi:hypothetical protein